ncbi:DMT family transporter [Planococcus sp. YIM B11945]|uniref:DMT family transporter n=1 Tax=Planococcus sp. YIM B11945 TaxID=3435410 RepID=UPI003D7D96CE
MPYLFLALAIIGELIGSSLLKASEGFSKLVPTAGMIASFVFSFFFLSLALKYIPLNVAYAIWSGLGMVATTIISVLIWKEKINFASVAGIVLIIIGVVILNFYGPSQGESAKAGKSAIQQNEAETR